MGDNDSGRGEKTGSGLDRGVWLRRAVLMLLACLLVALAVLVWIGRLPVLGILTDNKDVIDVLDNIVAIVLGLGAIGSAMTAWWSRKKPAEQAAAEAVTVVESPRIGGDQNIVEVGHDLVGTKVVGSNNVVGDNNVVTILTEAGGTDPDSLRLSYLAYLFQTAGLLQLSGVDPKAKSETNAKLSLAAVYTALLTETPEEQEHFERKAEPIRSQRRISALEQLNRHPRLVLLGDPGSGKSTFVNFVALCLAGEALSHGEANLQLLAKPLPKEPGEREEPQPQKWDHGALLPVRVVLRDFAARGLPSAGKRATAKHLWNFIASELSACQLGEYAPLLDRHLREQGGLLLVDGLDEVPEAEQRRVQIKQAVEDFAHSYPRVRILVTSRTYAYQKQDWQLNNFRVAILAHFSRGQIEQFITRWYEHIAVVRKLNLQDAQGRAVQLRQAIFSSDRLQGLAERPLLLTLMASLHAWRGGSLPEKREELYADTVELLLDWWERPKEVRDAQGGEALRQPSLAEWLKVDRAKVRGLLDELAYQAHATQTDLNGTADIAQGLLVDGLMRLANNPDVNPARLVEYLRDRAGLLLPRGEGVYAFPHRTFQEYLAACYLTDHDYPEKVAELACADFNRWREVALLAGAKARRGTASAVWSLVDALCYNDDPETECGEQAALLGAHLAAQMLVESASLEKVSERNQGKVERVRGWLKHILKHSALDTRERALAGNSLAQLGDDRREVLTIEGMELCFVPGGPLRMGSGEEDATARKVEKPAHEVSLPDFWIGRYPVTRAQFGSFVGEHGYEEESFWQEAREAGYWTDGKFTGRFDNEARQGPYVFGGVFDLPNHPVVGVSWYEALAFTRWLEEKALSAGWLPAGWHVALPSEAEWEKAARGGIQLPAKLCVRALNRLELAEEPGLIERAVGDWRIYPWGDVFDAERANTRESGIGATSAVGCFARGASVYGVEELSGNVWEWMRSLFKEYPYDRTDGREDPRESGSRVLRGGSWCDSEWLARWALRFRLDPISRDDYGGFRVVALPSSTLNSGTLNL